MKSELQASFFGSQAPLLRAENFDLEKVIVKKLRVLLVEDDEDNREMLSMFLSRDGFEVISTASSAEAKAVVAQQAVDVVVMDMNLPDGCGEDLARDLRAVCSAPRIALSGRAVGESSLFADKIMKPIYPSVLATKIRSVVSAQH